MTTSTVGPILATAGLLVFLLGWKTSFLEQVFIRFSSPLVYKGFFALFRF